MASSLAALGRLAFISLWTQGVSPAVPSGVGVTATADTVVVRAGDRGLLDCPTLRSSTTRYRVYATPTEPPRPTRADGTLTYAWTVGTDNVVETATRRAPYPSGVITIVTKATFHQRTLAPRSVEIRSWSVNPDQVTQETYTFDGRRVSHRLHQADGQWSERDTTFLDPPFLVGEELLLLQCLGALYRQNVVIGAVATDYDGMTERFILDTVYAHVTGSDKLRTDSGAITETWVVEMGRTKYWVRKQSLTVMRWVALPWGENYTGYTFVRQE